MNPVLARTAGLEASIDFELLSKCLPLVEWIVSVLPEGGADDRPAEWSDEQLEQLRADFFASPRDDDAHRLLFESILAFGTQQGLDDPVRWSAVVVEVLLIDWLPSTLTESADYLVKAPELGRAVVRSAHAERGTRQSRRGTRWSMRDARGARHERSRLAKELDRSQARASIKEPRWSSMPVAIGLRETVSKTAARASVGQTVEHESCLF
ncbi:hypothetical protein [Cryobacterium sp. Y11]|uniref:hypothetical protein n=1 Tax=Cryobacterium sp. Y11 TaxID=2045016 RepID=UPI0011B06531|nr:hypothetical protein [Cryobacterium sp. Y11]